VLLPAPGHLSLLVPDGETLNVKLKTFVGRLADTFHYDLTGFLRCERAGDRAHRYYIHAELLRVQHRLKT